MDEEVDEEDVSKQRSFEAPLVKSRWSRELSRVR